LLATNPQTPDIVNVNELTIEDALESLRSRENGLSAAEADRRLIEFGPNRIERAERVPIALRLAREFTHFFAIVLWIAALLALAADLLAPGQGMRALAIAIVAVIALNGVFSFWQEYRAEDAFLALQRLLPREVTALRNGGALRIAAETLVPGDVIFLEASDHVPADCRVIQAFALRVK
jgi:magnesium-transporting ATPase (P-type)